MIMDVIVVLAASSSGLIGILFLWLSWRIAAAPRSSWDRNRRAGKQGLPIPDIDIFDILR